MTMMAAPLIQQLRDQVAKAELERDHWRGRSDALFRSACETLADLRRQLRAAEVRYIQYST